MSGDGRGIEVVVLDMARDFERILEARTISELQWRRPAAAGRWSLGRLLVVDQVDNVFSHEAAYERLIRDSRSVSDLLVLLHGADAHLLPEEAKSSEDEARSDSVALRLPPVLAEESAAVPRPAVVWVIDERGVGWEVGSSRCGDLFVGEPPATQQLIAALEVPEVFDAVRAHMATLRCPVACPAVKLLDMGHAAAELLPAAAARAAAALGERTTPSFGPSGNQLNSRLADLAARTELHFTEVYSNEGELWRVAAALVRSVAVAQQRAEEIADAPIPEPARTRELANATRDVGARLSRLRELVLSTATMVDGRDGIDEEENARLLRLGLRPDVSQKVSRPGRADALRTVILDLLDQLRSLPAVANRCDEFAESVAPRSVDGHEARLQETCPQSLVDSLSKAQPPTVGSPRAMVTATGIAALAATSWRGGWPWAPLAAVVAGCVVVAVTRGLFIPAPSDRSKLALAMAVICGGALGALLATETGLRDMPVAVGLPLTLASPALIATTVVVAWRAAVRRWLAELPLSKAATSPPALLTALADLTVNDWVDSEERRQLARTARTVATALRAARECLMLDLHDPAAIGRRSGSHEFELNPDQVEAVVLDDYLNVLMTALREEWHSLRLGDDVSQAVDRFSSAVTDGLANYAEHLISEGVLAAPPRSSANGRRPTLLAALWRRVAGLSQLLGTPLTDRSLRQLCTPEALKLLSWDPDEARAVRFAPQVAQLETLPDPATELIVTVADAEVGGVLRLVPLRESSVAFRPPPEIDLTELPGPRPGHRAVPAAAKFE